MKENLELERKDIRIDPELEVDDDNQKQINFMVDAFFDVDKKFNININDEEGTWLNIWGFYNPFDDELKIKCQISRDIDNDEWKLIKDMVAERIQRYHNETPQEFCQSVWDEGETEGPVMGGM